MAPQNMFMVKNGRLCLSARKIVHQHFTLGSLSGQWHIASVRLGPKWISTPQWFRNTVKIEVWGGATLAGKQCLTNSRGSKGPHLGDPDPPDLPQRIGWGK